MQMNVVRNRLTELDAWTKMARTILESGKTLPNASIGIEIYANEHGRVLCRQWLDPWGRLREKETNDEEETEDKVPPKFEPEPRPTLDQLLKEAKKA